MQVNISQSQAQYLVTRLSIVAQGEQEYRKQMRYWEGVMWSKSDKEAPNGDLYFEELNTVRDSIRESKIEEAKINAVIRQLRKVR